jgi:putative transcriptional regulator
MARKTLNDIMAASTVIDRAKMKATTEADIRRHRIEDGEDITKSVDDFEWTISPTSVREKLGLTQAEFSSVTKIPKGTIRNWEQHRTKPDATARALLTILNREPKRAVAALAAAATRRSNAAKGSDKKSKG